MGIDEAGFDERHQRQQHRRRVTAGTGDETRGGDLLSVKLRQPVDCLPLQLRCAMVVAIPLRIGCPIAEPEIGRHVEHLDQGIDLQHGGDDLLRGAMRKPAEDDVDPTPIDLFPCSQHGQIERKEMRKHVRHRLAHMGIGGERGNLDVRMPRQQPHSVRTGIAGRAEDSDLPGTHGLVSTGWFANASGRAFRINAATARDPDSDCAASAPATATKSASDLCWLSLKLPSTSSTAMTKPTMAFFMVCNRAVVILSDVQGFFGKSLSSNFAVSVSTCTASSSSETLRTGPLRCTDW